jgi:hypothetical protein
MRMSPFLVRIARFAMIIYNIISTLIALVCMRCATARVAQEEGHHAEHGLERKASEPVQAFRRGPHRLAPYRIHEAALTRRYK